MFCSRLTSEESIQMVTALALQLIQCVVQLPVQDANEEDSEEKKKEKISAEVIRERGGVLLSIFCSATLGTVTDLLC